MSGVLKNGRSKKIDYDVIIAGGGLAGLTLTCFLGRAGIATACIDEALADKTKDLRTTAISYGSRKILEEAGLWQNLSGAICAIEDIRILDGNSPVLLNFLSAEAKDKSFGWIVENTDLRQAALKTIRSFKCVKHITGMRIENYEIKPDHATAFLQGGRKLTARLIVGVDGRKSFTREWMDVRTREWNYDQCAIICTVIHQNPHHNAAVEHFQTGGPFAILPMADAPDGSHRSSVVFTEHGPVKNSLMKMGDKTFETALAAKFPHAYGDIRLTGKRMSYPLSLVHAASYIGPRMALVADAAHGIHPIAGQGLNLGFRDVKALADLVIGWHRQKKDVGSDDLLKVYQRARRFDNMTMVAVTDALVRLFSNDNPPARALRRAGLKMVARLPAARRFFMRRAMGER